MSTATDQPTPQSEQPTQTAAATFARDCPNCRADSNARAQCPLCANFGAHEAPCYHGPSEQPDWLNPAGEIQRHQVITATDTRNEVRRRIELLRSPNDPPSHYLIQAKALEGLLTWLEEDIR